MPRKKKKHVVITQQMIREKVEEVIELIGQYEGSQADMAYLSCLNIIAMTADTHFEGVGMCTELLFSYRNRSQEILDEAEQSEEEEIEHIEDDIKDDKLKIN